MNEVAKKTLISFGVVMAVAAMIGGLILFESTLDDMQRMLVGAGLAGVMGFVIVSSMVIITVFDLD